MTCRAGSRPAPVSLASPDAQPPSVRHSASSSGPAARWIAPSTPPPPSSVVFAAFTIASTSSLVMSPRTISILVADFFTSRRQAFDHPITAGMSRITEGILQVLRPYLPEFDHFGFYAISAPVWRQWNGLVAKPLCHLRHARV